MNKPRPIASLAGARSLLTEPLFQSTPLSWATSTLIRGVESLYVVTNRHNVTGRNNETGEPLHSQGGIPDRIRVHYHATSNLGERCIREEAILDASNDPLWIEHPVFRGAMDVVALPVSSDGIWDQCWDPFDTDAFDVFISDTISVIGYPFGRTQQYGLPVFATGFLASEMELNFDDKPQLLVDCRTRSGQSGSPVVAYRPLGSMAFYNGKPGIF